MIAAFAVEKMSRFSGAFCFTALWLFATPQVGARFIAAGYLLFGYSDWYFLFFRHFQFSPGFGWRQHCIKREIILDCRRQ
jgi:hypothetical protein